MERKTFNIPKISCGHCVMTIKRELGELDGVFSGYNEKDSKYDKKTWAYQLDEKGVPKKDPTLQDPNCVFQLLKKHYSRYTIDKVSQITGTPKERNARTSATWPGRRSGSSPRKPESL